MIREPDVIDALAQALGRARSVLGKAPPDKQVAAAAALAAITDLAEELAAYSDAPEHFLSKCGLSQVKCFACDKPVRSSAIREADTRDAQIVQVGPDCFKRIQRAGQGGYQPRLGGPRLYPLTSPAAPALPATSP